MCRCPKEEGEGANYVLVEPEDFNFMSPQDLKEDISVEAGEFIFELPIDYGGTLDNDYKAHKDSLMAFDIKTGAEAAQKAYEARGKPESYAQFDGCYFGSLKLAKPPKAGTGVEL